MKGSYVVFFMILLSARASSNETFNTHIVNLAFCESNLLPTDKMGKETLEDLHTYAELKDDPRASLPDSFTVCSNIMITDCLGDMWPTFFNLLNNNSGQFLISLLNHGFVESRLVVYLPGDYRPNPNLIGKVPYLFPNQWIRSCTAVNTTSGQIHWVVEGTLVQTLRSEELANSKRRPMDLSKKHICSLGYLVTNLVMNLVIP